MTYLGGIDAASVQVLSPQPKSLGAGTVLLGAVVAILQSMSR